MGGAPIIQTSLLEVSESSPLNFFQYSLAEAAQKVGELCDKKYHGSSFVNYVYRLKHSRIDDMLSIPAANREKLSHLVDISPLTIRKRLVSADGTVKFLFEVQTPKGPQDIEAVYIPDETRVTLCVSSQVGCKMACSFCLTAQLGFRAHLPASDIVRQFWTVSLDPELRPVTNIVFMGMGEPFDNLEEVRRATSILTDVRGFNLSAKKITVSTVGLVDRINELKKEEPFRLAVSLNASDDETRDRIMPVNRKWKMKELLEACRQYTKRTNKKVTFEYILMAGVTDRPEDIQNLIRCLSPIPCKVNLIPYNESPYTEFRRPADERIQAFHAALLKAQLPVFIRKNRGNDIFAACGMLKRIDPAA